MRRRSLTILSVAALLAGVQFWGRFDAAVSAAGQLPSPNRPLFEGFPGMDEPFNWEHVRPRVPFPGNASSSTLIAATGIVCTIDAQGRTASPFSPLGASYRGALNMGLTLVESEAGPPQLVVFAGPGGPSTHPMTAFVFGPPHRSLGEFGKIDGQDAAGVSIASGNYSADAGTEFVFAPGPGVPGAVHFVTLGRDDAVKIFPFGETFTGGINVAVGNLDGRGYEEVIVGQASGGGLVQVYGMDGDAPQLIGAGFPYGPGFTGGVFVTAFDINNDGAADLFVSPGAGTATVRAFDFKIAENEPPRPQPRVLFNYTPFGENHTGGVRVAVGISEGAPVIAAVWEDLYRQHVLRNFFDRDREVLLEQTYSGRPFGAGVSAIDVKMTPPR